MTRTELKGAQHAASRCLDAGKYFAMAWAANAMIWNDVAMDAFREAALALGYTLTPIAAFPPAPSVTMPAPDDRPVTFSTTDAGRR